MPTRVKIRFQKTEEKNKLVTLVQTIKNIDEDMVYKFPCEVQHERYHSELFTISTVLNGTKSMAKVGQYRNLIVSLPDTITSLYLDHEGNFVFNDFYLEELSSDTQLVTSIRDNCDNNGTAELLRLINNLQSKLAVRESSLNDIEKKFILEKFNGKQQNAKEWLTNFEKECERHNITDNNKKVQILRFFIQGSAQEWYSSNLKKLSLDDWNAWSASFLMVYATKGWSEVRFAYNYRYMGGSLVDFSVKKERLLLEVEKSISHTSRINAIVISLPLTVQDKLDREEIHTTDELMNTLRKYETYSYKIKSEMSNSTSNSAYGNNTSKDKKMYAKNFGDRKPCYICEKLGKQNLYHPPEVCRNKQRSAERGQINMVEDSQGEQNEEGLEAIPLSKN